MVKEYSINGISGSWLHQAGMMVYVETEYNEEVNIVIKRYYEEISEWCKGHGLIFLYIPKFYTSCGSGWVYYMTGKKYWELPYDTTSIVLKHSLSESSFMQIKGASILFTNNSSDGVLAYLIDDKNEYSIEDSIEFILSTYQGNTLSSVEKELFVDNLDRLCSLFRRNRMDARIKARTEEDEVKYRELLTFQKTEWISNILEVDDVDEKPCRFRVKPKDEVSVEFQLFSAESELHENSVIDMHLFKEALNAITELMKRGYSKETIWAMLNPMQELSPIHITKDLRIVLPLYNKEIELPPIQKAVYILFLKHPEGIYFKELSDYETDLYRIYRRLAVRGMNTRHIETIKEIVNPISNSMNEKCSIIKKRITALLDDSLAKHYYISGGKGELKRIDIKPDMIVWE